MQKQCYGQFHYGFANYVLSYTEKELTWRNRFKNGSIVSLTMYVFCYTEKEQVPIPKELTLELRPVSNGAWATVQAISHNPRLRIHLPSNRRLSAVINFLNKKWKSHRLRLVSFTYLVLSECQNFNNVIFTTYFQLGIQTGLGGRISRAQASHTGDWEFSPQSREFILVASQPGQSG